MSCSAGVVWVFWVFEVLLGILQIGTEAISLWGALLNGADLIRFSKGFLTFGSRLETRPPNHCRLICKKYWSKEQCGRPWHDEELHLDWDLLDIHLWYFLNVAWHLCALSWSLCFPERQKLQSPGGYPGCLRVASGKWETENSTYW